MVGADALRKYTKARDEARQKGESPPTYPNVRRCVKCRWSGHEKPFAGVCPLNPEYSGLLPRCHFNRPKARKWLQRRRSRMNEKKEAAEAERPHVCEYCSRRYHVRGQMTSCRKRCKEKQESKFKCETIGCAYVGTDAEDLKNM